MDKCNLLKSIVYLYKTYNFYTLSLKGLGQKDALN